MQVIFSIWRRIRFRYLSLKRSYKRSCFFEISYTKNRTGTVCNHLLPLVTKYIFKISWEMSMFNAPLWIYSSNLFSIFLGTAYGKVSTILYILVLFENNIFLKICHDFLKICHGGEMGLNLWLSQFSLMYHAKYIG